ncbi:hypothetical protein BJV82DRAFT_34125 [Fennellomyces sp. T-0311]|nr:hypothetical protein BJV82DRAFT_34125 [Fennellomyces sp. T-0311]
MANPLSQWKFGSCIRIIIQISLHQVYSIMRFSTALLGFMALLLISTVSAKEYPGPCTPEDEAAGCTKGYNAFIGPKCICD